MINFFLILSLVFPQKLEEKIYKIGEENILLDSFNGVYLSENDTLKKLNKSVDTRVSINSYRFQLSDTIVKFGGYGFWSQRNFMYYFDTSTNEWELYPINYSDEIEGSFGGQTFINSEKVLFLGGNKVSKNNRLKIIGSSEVVEYDIKSRELKNIGEITIEFKDKKIFYKTDTIVYLYDQQSFYVINPFENIVSQFKKPPILNYNFDVYYENETFRIEQKNEPKRVFYLIDDFDVKNPIDSYPLYKRTFKFNSVVLTTLFIVSLIVLILLIIRTKNRNSNIEIFTTEEIKILNQLRLKDVLFNDLLKDNYEKEISYVHNTRQLNSKLKSISLKLKTKYNTVENPIVKTKYHKDKRLIMVSLSDEIKKILKKNPIS